MFGTLSESTKHALPGCQASHNFKRDRTYHTRGTQLKLARKLVDSFVSHGTLSEALEQLYAADSDDFLKRLLVLVLPTKREGTEKCCYSCFKTHFLDVLTPQHACFSTLEPAQKPDDDVSSQMAAARKRGAAAAASDPAAGPADGHKRLRSSAEAKVAAHVVAYCPVSDVDADGGHT